MGIFKNKNQSLYHIGDSLLCCFLFFPAMMLYWRGIWDLWGVYIFPEQYPKQTWTLFAISLITIIGYFILPLIETQRANVAKQKDGSLYSKVVFPGFFRAYFMVYASFYMCYWRAVWDLADYYLPTDLAGSLINLVCTYMALVVFRASRCCIFPPMFTLLDTRPDVLTVSTRFSTKPYSIKYFFDCLFSHYILLGFTILTWRGMWNTLGHLIIPDNVTKSDLVCLAGGYILILLVFLLEEPLAFVTHKLAQKGFYYKLVWEDTIYAIIFILHGILWRGGWNVTATYVIPDPELGGWVCFICGTIALSILQLFSYVSAHGVAVDGADQGRDAIFPTKYLRVYLNSNREECYELERQNVSYTEETREITTVSATVQLPTVLT